MTETVYIPCDSGSRSLGADAIVKAIATEAEKRKRSIKLVRTGSRGLYWLEPMIEVDISGKRLAYGPVAAADIPTLFDADFLHGGSHRLALSDPEEIPYLKKQERVTFVRLGIVEPVSLDDYVAHGGYRGLDRALTLSPEQVVEEVTVSGLRGRGG